MEKLENGRQGVYIYNKKIEWNKSLHLYCICIFLHFYIFIFFKQSLKRGIWEIKNRLSDHYCKNSKRLFNMHVISMHIENQ